MRTLCILVLTLSVALGAGAPPERLWPPQYKLRPADKARLTAADVVGPDGIVYPNWRACGVLGGIPKVRVFCRIEDHGARADDNRDDSAALDAACRAAGETGGGGAVLLGAGTYHLDRPVTVRHHGVVIRGQGAGKTKLIFRYGIGAKGARFYWPPAGSRVGKATRVQLHCTPKNLMKMTVSLAGKTLGTWTRSKHSGNTFSFSVSGETALRAGAAGKAVLVGTGEYRDGKKTTAQLAVVLDPSYRLARPVADSRCAIQFTGGGTAGPKQPLASDGRRGADTVTLQDLGALRAGDWVLIDGPATARWKKLTRNACKWGLYRRNILQIRRVDAKAKTVQFTQPLRIDFPAIDGSYLQKLGMILRCGLEDLYLEQTENLWITACEFRYAANCWARGVKVYKHGRFPVYGSSAKWCEIRDCVFDDAHFKGGGGTAYAGWDRCYDCLMDGCTTYKLRHGPLFQWSASGCVIRRSTFHDSDAQWHAGWTNENLIEQCVVYSRRGTGSYGFGAWASPPGDAAHGPNGPRNVVYNCDIHSQREGLWMGGMNENWLILHNRFVVDKGAGVVAKTFSHDHIIQGNVFVLKDGRSPMIHLQTADCVGVEILDNALYGGAGSAKLLAGPARPAVMNSNRAAALPKGKLPPRPKPTVPSIYQWQNRRR